MLGRAEGPPSWFCIEASGIGDVDFSGGQTLLDLVAEMQQAGTRLVFAEMTDDVHGQLDRYGVTDEVGHDAYFDTPMDVMDAFRTHGPKGGRDGVREDATPPPPSDLRRRHRSQPERASPPDRTSKRRYATFDGSHRHVPSKSTFGSGRAIPIWVYSRSLDTVHIRVGARGPDLGWTLFSARSLTITVQTPTSRSFSCTIGRIASRLTGPNGSRRSGPESYRGRPSGLASRGQAGRSPPSRTLRPIRLRDANGPARSRDLRPWAMTPVCGCPGSAGWQGRLMEDGAPAGSRGR